MKTKKLSHMMRHALILALLASPVAMLAQSFVHEQSKTYVGPKDPLVIEKLHNWQDQKFGIIFHWGLYAVPGIVESWQLTSEDWITPDPEKSYEEYKQWYWGLKDLFNPHKFDPAQWARVSKAAGARYMIFTSKHHDGFCLFDSKQTDFTVTHGPFARNPKANILKHVFDAFRAEGLMIGCYFSKPDWHSENYWWPAKATPNRSHNYKIEQYPERWANYQKYVYNQAYELMHDYGHIDIFWLDGGWCEAPREDIKLGEIVDMAREAQPGLIVVNRACPGPYEDYQTPEQTIPEHQITTPWESCVTLTYDWGWTRHPHFKTPARVIGMLSEVVAKGGSLVLGIGPSPEGLIDEDNVERLEAIGAWLDKNGEAIYETVVTDVYTTEAKDVWFTANKDGKTLYALVPQKDGEDMPQTISWKGNVPVKGSKIIMLANGKAVKYATTADGTTTVTLPAGLNKSNGVVLKFSVKK